MKPPKLRLSLNDRNSGLWADIAAEVERRLAVYRARLEKDLDERATAKIRGRIEAYKEVLAFASDEPADLSDDTPA